jgi:hypothetical protein
VEKRCPALQDPIDDRSWPQRTAKRMGLLIDILKLAPERADFHTLFAILIKRRETSMILNLDSHLQEVCFMDDVWLRK